MSKLKRLVLMTLVGATLGFSLWPVLSGIDYSKSCEEALNDCALPEQKTARIIYLVKGQRFNDPAFNSRSEYCKIASSCTSEAVAVPVSIFTGAVVGALLGFGWLRKRPGK